MCKVAAPGSDLRCKWQKTFDCNRRWQSAGFNYATEPKVGEALLEDQSGDRPGTLPFELAAIEIDVRWVDGRRLPQSSPPARDLRQRSAGGCVPERTFVVKGE